MQSEEEYIIEAGNIDKTGKVHTSGAALGNIALEACTICCGATIGGRDINMPPDAPNIDTVSQSTA